MKTLEIMATRSQKNILKLLKHKQRLSKLKTQISSWSQHEVLITLSEDGSGQYAAVLCHMEHLSSTSKNAVACTLRSL